jgi:nucleotide-binding universal stress UspA family protein
MTGTVLVGYDGSETGRAALAYAAQRVGPGGRVVVAHVVAAPTAFIDTQYHEVSLRRARERGEASMRDVEDLLGGVTAELQVAEGPPGRTLVELAREAGADEIVVGSRGFGGGRAMLGSVAHALLHETDRPVVILTRRAAERQAASALPAQVVGYDGSPAARAALDYGFVRAHGHVTVVYAYDAPSSFLGAAYFGEALTDSQMRGRELLDELQSQDGLGPDVEFDLFEGPPAEAVASAAMPRDADEIIVGSRGLGRFRGAFGSVSHALLHEADRPVVVVPQPTMA